MKIEIHKADTGGFVVITPKKCLQVPKLETALSEIRSAFRAGESEPQEECPYCHSTDTIGHGLKETSTQILTRRLCNDCHKTWSSNREEKEGQITNTIQLHLEEIKAEDTTEQPEATVQPESPEAQVAQEPTEAATEPEQAGLAPEFDRAKALKEHIGNFTVWKYNGSLAASPKGKQEVVYLTRTAILHMKTLRNGAEGKTALAEYISQYPEHDRQAIRDLVETLIDEDLGMLPMVKIQTRAEDGGEIDAELLEEGEIIGVA